MKLIVPGLANKIVRAYSLKDIGKKKLPVEITGSDASVNVSNITQSDYATVIVLEIKGKPVVDVPAQALPVSR